MATASKTTLTTLSKSEVARVSKIAHDYLQQHPSINNRILRRLTGIGYDQASFLFRVMLQQHQLQKSGKASSTIYTLPNPPANK